MNYDKLHLTPTTHLEFLGFLLDSVAYTISVLPMKRKGLYKLVHIALDSAHITIRFLAKIIGVIVSFFPACPEAPLHYRALDRYKSKKLHIKGHWGASITIDESCSTELAWLSSVLLSHDSLFTRSLVTDTPACNLFTDACLTQWGGVLGEVEVN